MEKIEFEGLTPEAIRDMKFLDNAKSVGIETSYDYLQSDNQNADDIKMEFAARKYAEFLDAVYPQWRGDKSMAETPKRVAKMYIKELFSGVHGKPPKITDFSNSGLSQYSGIVFQGGIDVKSVCSHHIMPFFGKAYVSYIPSDKENSRIIGLSKLNRLVDFCSRRPQVQEALTGQIHDLVAEIIGENKGIAVHIVACHTCVSLRGVNQDSAMQTSKLSGLFFTNDIGTRDEFYRFVDNHISNNK